MVKKPRVFIWQGTWRGGAERVMLGLAEAFRKHFKIEPVLGVFERSGSVDFEQIRVKSVFPKKAIGYNTMWASLYLSRSGLLDGFDIVVAHGGGFWKTGRNFYVCHEAGDLDALARNLPFFSRITFFPLRGLYIRNIRRADLVISATRECDRFLERHGVRSYVRGRNFVDTKLFRPGERRPGETFAVLFVGRDEPRKNLAALKDACRALGGDVVLYIIGAEGKSENNIKYLGYVSDEELAEWYRRVNVFALPSFWEGFPITVLEAMASGTPVLASVYAVPEELREFAITFNPYSEGELLEKLRWIRQNYGEAIKISEKARRFVVENYEKEKVLKWEVRTILKEFERRRKR